MRAKTRGIVLGTIRYKETSIIAHVFTEQFGFRSYVTNNVHASKGKSKAALFQPLTILEMVVYEKGGANLQRIAEYNCAFPFKSIPFNFNKTTVCIFLSEILSRCLRNEQEQADCYQFLERMIIQFDSKETSYEDFHLFILMHLSRFLGFSVTDSMDSVFESVDIDRGIVLSRVEIVDLGKKLSILYTGNGEPVLDGKERRLCLWLLVTFFQRHIENLGKINSYEVMRELY